MQNKIVYRDGQKSYLKYVGINERLQLACKNRSLSLLLAARAISPGSEHQGMRRDSYFSLARLEGLSSDFEGHESVVYCHKSNRQEVYESQEGSATFQYTILKLCAQCIGL